VSLLMKGDPNVIGRLKSVSRADVCIPQPVVAEIAYGIQRLSRSKRRDALTSRFELLKSEIRRVTWSDEVSDAFAGIKSGLERRASGSRREHPSPEATTSNSERPCLGHRMLRYQSENNR